MLKNITISQISQTNPLDSAVTIFFNNDVSLEMTPDGVLKMLDHYSGCCEDNNIRASFNWGLQTAVEQFKKLAEAATLMAAEAQRAIEMQEEKKEATPVITTTTTTTTAIL